MSVIDPGAPPELVFLGAFDAFFREVSRLVDSIRNPEPDEGADGAAELSAGGVRRRLKAVLGDLQADVSRQVGAFETQQFREVEYLLSALADEVFLELEWPDRAQWRENLLESEVFNTHDAGERVFESLDRLLAERDSATRGLGVVYLLALALGFQGRHADHPDGVETLLQYRRRLYAFIYGGSPNRRIENEPLCPQAHLHVLQSDSDERFPSVKKWLAVGSLAMLVLVLVSHLVWLGGIQPISKALDGISVEVTR
ncbi:MAG: type VI secretion system protein ImpK [Myxococcota bacterium]